jgi:hypothetical protein
LESEGVITDVLKYQIYSNLKIALEDSLLDKDGQKFIQSDGSKKYRISTHLDFTTLSLTTKRSYSLTKTTISGSLPKSCPNGRRRKVELHLSQSFGGEGLSWYVL